MAGRIGGEDEAEEEGIEVGDLVVMLGAPNWGAVSVGADHFRGGSHQHLADSIV